MHYADDDGDGNDKALVLLEMVECVQSKSRLLMADCKDVLVDKINGCLVVYEWYLKNRVQLIRI